MKKNLVLAGLLAATLSSQGQYLTTSGTPPASCAQVYQAGNGAGTLHFPWASGGLLIQSNCGDRALMELQTPSSTGVGANRTVFQAHIGGTYLDIANATHDFFLMNSGSKIAVGHTSPQAKLHIVETNQNFTATQWIESTLSNPSGMNRALQVDANNADYNWAGVFVAGGNTTKTQNLAVYGACAMPYTGNDWAGYFEGRTYCTFGIWSASDRKLKENIQPMKSALDKIMLLKPSTYTFKKDLKISLPEGKQMGLIAQELEEIFPEAVADVKAIEQKNSKGEVVVSSPDHKSVNYTTLIPALIAGMQEQQKMINDLKTELEQTRANTTGLNDNGQLNSFRMEQNEPNPFTHETTVRYNLPANTKSAYMAVYDLSGKQVTTLPVDLSKGAITVTSEKLSAGIYIYSIVADGKALDSKKMIVADK